MSAPPFTFKETPDAHSIIAKHEHPEVQLYGTGYPATELLQRDVDAYKTLCRDKKIPVDFININADDKKNQDLMLQFKVIETPESSALPTVIFVNNQGDMVDWQKGVYGPGDEANQTNLDNIQVGIMMAIEVNGPGQAENQTNLANIKASIIKSIEHEKVVAAAKNATVEANKKVDK